MSEKEEKVEQKSQCITCFWRDRDLISCILKGGDCSDCRAEYCPDYTFEEDVES